jgi:hypothetical protein
VSQDNYSNPSLQRFISDPENQGASVVVRDPSVNRDGVSTNPVNSRVCALIERGLMEKYNPRDRKLFENAVAKLEDGSDYPAIRKVTGTDLIFEITKFNAVEYEVSEYYDGLQRRHPFTIKKSKEEVITPTYVLIGFSIEIKVILLADNLIAGIFKYDQIPCMNGCNVTNFTENTLSYSDPNTAKTSVAREISSHGMISFDRYDTQIANFISKFVIPTMFRQMAGEQVSESSNLQAGIQTGEETPKNAGEEGLAKLVKSVMTKKERAIDNAKQRQEQIQQKQEQEIEQEKAIALSSPNSYDMAASVSNLIFDAIKDSKKSGKYTNDIERFANLKNREQIANYITSITTNVASFPEENSDRIVFYCTRKWGKDKEAPLLLFLDGKCIGVGTVTKGLLTKIPTTEFTGMHSIALWNNERELLNIPVDFSFKTYYKFGWNRNSIALQN